MATGSLGKVITSTDGSTWGTVTSGAVNTLSGVSCSPTLCVAVVGGGEVITSTDGSNWGKPSSGTTNGLDGVSCTTMCVAVGVGGTIITSTDGSSWSTVTSGTGNVLDGISCTTGLCLAVANNGSILSSTDGANWVTASSGTINNLNGVSCTGAGLCRTAGLNGTILGNYYIARNSFDNGQAYLGSLSRALANSPAGQPIYVLPTGNTLAISQTLPALAVGTKLVGQCGASGPTITINGYGLAGDGLTLTGNTKLSGLVVKGFAGREIVASSNGGGPIPLAVLKFKSRVK